MAAFMSPNHQLHTQPALPHQSLPSNTPPEQRPSNMNNPMQRTPSQHLVNGSRGQHRMSGEFRNRGPVGANGNGAMPVPSASQSPLPNGQHRNVSAGPGAGVFDMPRSPPSTKSTSHVPCKFFRQGACQAGKACPFLHSTDNATETAPCKYFTKGNCKFGAKCALAHILPDGRRVNRPNMGPMGVGMGGGHLNLGGRVNPQPFHNQDSALATSLLTQQHANGGGSGPVFGNNQYPYILPEDYTGVAPGAQSAYDNIPHIDTSVASNPGSKYGSPKDDLRNPISPVSGHLTARDAPFPASFDSQGISNVARFGPAAASVPSRFGLESSPIPSFSQKQDYPSEALRNLRDTAFGTESRKPIANLGSSPGAVQDEQYGQRVMHSQRASRPKMLSASLPRTSAADEWDPNFAFEDDLLPGALHDELLTPQEKAEKARRMSRTEQDLNSKEYPIGLGVPTSATTKVGSPLGSSPSRFGALFARQRQKKEEDAAAVGASPFGHVGSPLRESSLHPSASPSLRPVGSRPTSGDASPYFSSPPRQSSMSMISQQLQRTRLGRNEPADSSQPVLPSGTRHSSAPTRPMDRTVSSSNVGTSRIEEEQGEFVFSMEEEEDRGRNSTTWSSVVGKPSGL